MKSKRSKILLSFIMLVYAIVIGGLLAAIIEVPEARLSTILLSGTPATTTAASPGEIGLKNETTPGNRNTSNGYTYCYPFPITTAGLVSYGHLMLGDNGGNSLNWCLTLYSLDGATAHGWGQITSSTAADGEWENILLTQTYTISDVSGDAGDDYILCVEPSGNGGGISVQTGNGWYDAQTYNCTSPPTTVAQEAAINQDILIVFDGNAGDPNL